LSQEETAQVLGIARGTVAATATQAARALRARMEGR
jgi:DNA-directed RNA polymerase specialized sigma24 family protein